MGAQVSDLRVVRLAELTPGSCGGGWADLRNPAGQVCRDSRKTQCPRASGLAS